MKTNGRKLHLNVDALAVESFEVDADARERGTVHGREYDPTFTAAGIYECPCDTSFGTCYGTCQASCANTCGGPGCEDNFPTFYLTCRQGCYWKTGNPCVAAFGLPNDTL